MAKRSKKKRSFGSPRAVHVSNRRNAMHDMKRAAKLVRDNLAKGNCEGAWIGARIVLMAAGEGIAETIAVRSRPGKGFSTRIDHRAYKMLDPFFKKCVRA